MRPAEFIPHFLTGVLFLQEAKVQIQTTLFSSTFSKVRLKSKHLVYELILKSTGDNKLGDENEVTFNTFSNGCLGSHNDEERSEMRYVMRIAETCESSKF